MSILAVPAAPAVSAPLPAANPFAAASPLPLHYPPFDRIRDDDFAPAFEAGMAEQRAEVAAITARRDAPTFDDTIVALERSGQLLQRVRVTFDNLRAADTDPARQALQARLAPQLAAHRDVIELDPALFARIDALHARRDALGLDPESRQLLERTHARFVHAGARLSAADQARLRALNTRLSTLTTTFQQNVLTATQAAAVEVDDVRRLDGMSTSQVAAAAAAAKARGLEGRWLITMQNTTTQPVLSVLKDRDLRRRVFEASSRRNVEGPYDNRPVVAEIVRLRAERARLLGYPNHAAWVLADETAKTPDAVNRMLRDLTGPALANARNDAADIQREIDRDAAATHGASFRLEPWDWAYYAERVRVARYAFDEAAVRPYFELSRVLEDGVFYAAHRAYGIDFRERRDLPVYRPDVRVFDVVDRDGSPLAIFIADDYARDSKQGGAWMSAYVTQSGLFDERPVVANHLNIPKPPPGEPTLLTFDEVETLFHEFGHALHGMFSQVRYRSLAGTAVPRDFVEYPSQFNEMWARDPEVLAHYARHHETGRPMPRDLLDKVLAAASFDQGYATTEYLAAAVLDQRWHQIGPDDAPDAAGVEAFEANALQSAGFDFGPVPPRYHTAYFSHVFAGGYSAGYYAYLWSEVLARDTEHWMKTHGGLDRANGDFLRAKVLSRGRSADVSTLFRTFYGRDPELGPLLEHRGLATPASIATPTRP